MSRLRIIPNALDKISLSNYYLKKNKKSIFKNKKVYLEIGSGKGQFLIKHAIKNPSINFIGVEKYSTVIWKAINKINLLEQKPKNIFFTCLDAKDLESFFSSCKFDKIFLNFSDPWPKKRHTKKRLTSNSFLDIYKKILKLNSIVEFKTDNETLFNFSIEVLRSRKDIKILYYTADLYSDITNENFVKNISTEYEDKFVALKIPIKKIVWTYK